MVRIIMRLLIEGNSVYFKYQYNFLKKQETYQSRLQLCLMHILLLTAICQFKQHRPYKG